MTPGSARLRAAAFGAALIAAALASGCYHLGFEPADELVADGRVAIPVFENHTLRRGLEHDLTRRVRQEVLETTPLHLARVGPGVAEVRGAIRAVEEQADVADARLEVHSASLRVRVSVGVYRDGALILGDDLDGDGTPDAPLELEGLAERAPAFGETRETAAAEALRDLAQQVALCLQGRRDDRFEPNDRRDDAATLSPQVRQAALRQRDPDWFRLALPPERVLRLTLAPSREASGLRVAVSDEAARPLADAVRAEGREVWVLGGHAPRELWVEVTGADAGERYDLRPDLVADDWREPDDDPEQATPILPGQVVRGVQRDSDWFRVPVPAGKGLRAAVRPADPPMPDVEGVLDLRVTEPSGLPLRGARPAPDARGVQVPPAPTDRDLLLRVGGDGRTFAYVLDVAVE